MDSYTIAFAFPVVYSSLRIKCILYCVCALTEAGKAAVEAASREAAQFKADCHDLLAWVSSATDSLKEAEAISGDPDTLRQQTRQNRVCICAIDCLFLFAYFVVVVWEGFLCVCVWGGGGGGSCCFGCCFFLSDLDLDIAVATEK